MSETTKPGSWFNFRLGFSDDGCDADTVRHILGVLHGYTVHVEGTGDVVVDAFEQPDDPYNNWPVYLTGWAYDETHASDDQYRGARVRLPLANAKITIY